MERFYQPYFFSLPLRWPNMVGVAAGMAVDGEDGMAAAGTEVGMDGADTAAGGMVYPGSGFMVYPFIWVILSSIRRPRRLSINRLRCHNRQSTRPLRHHISIGTMRFITQQCIARASAPVVASRDKIARRNSGNILARATRAFARLSYHSQPLYSSITLPVGLVNNFGPHQTGFDTPHKCRISGSIIPQHDSSFPGPDEIAASDWLERVRAEAYSAQ
jgi:hypothetical protein